MHKLLYPFFAKIEKRIRFVISSAILSFVLLLSTFFFFDKAFIFVPVFIVLAYALTYFSILEGIEKFEWVTLFLMPVLLTVIMYFFYFLFPVRWLTRVPFIIFYAVSMYAMLLVSNIFNVGEEKSLQLYRAGFSVNYFYQTLFMFLAANLILALRLNFLLNGIIFFLLGTMFAAHLFWSIKLELYVERAVALFAIFVGIIIGEVAIVASLAPLEISVVSLTLSAAYYGVAGLTYLHIDQRLFKETIREYLTVIVFVLIIVILSISW